MVKDHIAMVRKYPCQILTSDPATKTIQGVMKSGQIRIAVYGTDPFFRWPKTGENWWVRQENGTWYLDSILADTSDPSVATELEPGDAHINVPSGKIVISTGHTVARKFVEIVGDGSTKDFVVSHDLHDVSVHFTALGSESPYTPVTALSWAPEGPDKIKVSFTVAPAKEAVQIVVIG